MSKQLANMLDAVLPELPAVRLFLDTIIEVSQKPLASGKRGKDHLYGDSIHSVESKGGVPTSTFQAGLKVVQEFEAMRQDNNIEFKGLDAWSESMAMFVVDLVAMTGDVDGQTTIFDRRKRLCGDKYKLSPLSLRTYVNALAKAYNQATDGHGVVFSSFTQFPMFNTFMEIFCTSWRETLGLKEIATGDVEVLLDSDLLVLYEHVDFSPLYETQRWCMLLFMFRTGLRPESLGRLLVESVVIREENGEPMGYLEFVLGTMKNLPSKLAKCDAALFKHAPMHAFVPLMPLPNNVPCCLRKRAICSVMLSI